jgi:hypothetical protein
MDTYPTEPQGGREPDLSDFGGGEGQPTQADEKASLLAQLGELRQEIKEKAEPLHLTMPGYKGGLWVRFRPYSIARTERKIPQFQREQRKRKPVLLQGACDTLIDACDQLMLLPERFQGEIGDEGKNLIPIDEVTPVQFDQRLAQMFKVPGADVMTEARQVVVAMFPTEQAVVKMSLTVNEWLNGELSQEADEEFLGNSEGTRQ